MIFAMIVAIALQWIVALGLSELASAFPSSGVNLFTFSVRHSAKANIITGSIPLHVHDGPREV